MSKTKKQLQDEVNALRQQLDQARVSAPRTSRCTRPSMKVRVSASATFVKTLVVPTQDRKEARRMATNSILEDMAKMKAGKDIEVSISGIGEPEVCKA